MPQAQVMQSASCPFRLRVSGGNVDVLPLSCVMNFGTQDFIVYSADSIP